MPDRHRLATDAGPPVDLGIEAAVEHLVVDATIGQGAVERLLVRVPATAAPGQPLLMPEDGRSVGSARNPSRAGPHR